MTTPTTCIDHTDLTDHTDCYPNPNSGNTDYIHYINYTDIAYTA